MFLYLHLVSEFLCTGYITNSFVELWSIYFNRSIIVCEKERLVLPQVADFLVQFLSDLRNSAILVLSSLDMTIIEWVMLLSAFKCFWFIFDVR